MSETKPRPGALSARYLKMTETVDLTLIAVVLVILSVLLLGSSVAALYNSVVTGQIRDSAQTL